MARLKTKRTGKYDYDVIVVGGGQAGLAAASVLAAEGQRVAVVEAGALGGRLVNGGETARRALLYAARTYRDVKASGDIGIRGGTVGYNYPTLREWKRGIETDVISLTTAESLAAAGITLIVGTARFIDAHTVSVDRRHVTGGSFIVTTGSVPVVPVNVSGLSRIKYLTLPAATDLLKPPKSLFIIGGGPAGVESAELFTTFGSKVTIAEVAPRLLPREDGDVGDLLARQFTSRGTDVLTSTRVVSVVREALLYKVTYLRGDVEHVVKAEHVLLAAGANPALDLGLENADVDYTPLGISVSSAFVTTAKHIYAAGSVTGTADDAAGAVAQGRAAATSLLGRDKSAATGALSQAPRVTRAGVIVASVGVNESDALRRDIAATTRTVAASEVLDGIIDNSDGFVRLVADKRGVLVGATMAVDSADQAIAGLAGDIYRKTTVADIARLPYVPGTIGELVTRAAARFSDD